MTPSIGSVEPCSIWRRPCCGIKTTSLATESECGEKACLSRSVVCDGLNCQLWAHDRHDSCSHYLRPAGNSSSPLPAAPRTIAQPTLFRGWDYLDLVRTRRNVLFQNRSAHTEARPRQLTSCEGSFPAAVFRVVDGFLGLRGKYCVLRNPCILLHVARILLPYGDSHRTCSGG